MKTLTFTRLWLAVLLSISLVGCATTGMSNAERTLAYDQFIVSEKLEELNQITAFRFDSWSSLGQEHLIISTSFNRPYLISLRNSCFDLNTANVIGINNTGSTLHAKFDSITVPKSIGQKCFIKSIYKLTKEQKDALSKIGNEKAELKEHKNES